MVAPIASALAKGYTNKQIVQYLLRTFPQYSNEIEKALKYGFSPDRIIQYISKGRAGVTEQEGELTEHEQTRKNDKQNQRKLEKIIGGTALGIGAAGIGLGLGGQAALQGIQGLMGNTPNTPNNPPPIAPNQISAPNAAIPINPQSIAQPGGNIQPGAAVSPQIQEAAQQQAQQQPQINTIQANQPVQNLTAQDLFKEFPGIQTKIHDLLNSGNKDPNAIAGYFQKFGAGTVKKIEDKYGKPIVEFVKEYLSTLPPTEQQTSEIQKPSIEESIKKENLTPEVKTQNVAVLPNGELGNIKSIKGKVVKLDIDGKQKLMNLSKIIQSPLDSKDLGDLYDQLMQATPEKEKSAAIQWAGYDEKTNKLSYIPHGGALYTYEDIPEEWIDKLKNSMFKAKTSGSTTEGKWFAGGETRGGGLYQLIQELQKVAGGKGKEYSGKAEVVFDAFRPGREASRAKKKKAKDEEKKAKRKK